MQRLLEILRNNDVNHITLDSSVIMENKNNFKSGKLGALKNLEVFGISLILPEIIYDETYNHIKSTIEESIKLIRTNAQKLTNFNISDEFNFANASQVDADEITDRYLKSVIEEYKITILKYNSLTDISQVVKSYFEISPPFDKKKKSEFPDAIALHILEKYALDNNLKIIIISRDHGWRDICNNKDYFIYYEDLTTVLSAFNKNRSDINDGTESKLSELFNLENSRFRSLMFDELVNEISNFNFIPDGYSGYRVESELSDIELNDIELGDNTFKVIGSDNVNLLVNAKLNGSLTATAYFSFSVYDEGEFHIGGNEVTQDFDIDFDVTFSIPIPRSLSDLDITLNIDNFDCSYNENLDFGEVSPDWGDGDPDNEW